MSYLNDIVSHWFLSPPAPPWSFERFCTENDRKLKEKGSGDLL